jgi:hypothetical protein
MLHHTIRRVAEGLGVVLFVLILFVTWFRT